MKKRPLGNTGLNISVLGFGCASYWGMPYYSEKDAAQLINIAVDKGVNFFDTGHSYSHGNAEPRLGRVLKKIPQNIKHNLILSTKAGTKNKKYGGVIKDFSPSWIKQSVDLSLKQLGVEQISLLHLHGPWSLILLIPGRRVGLVMRYSGVSGRRLYSFVLLLHVYFG